MTDISDITLAPIGRKLIDWVRPCMPVLHAVEDEFKRTKPLLGFRMSISIHLEAKTAYLAHVLRAGGADVAVTGCNPLSTQDAVAASLASDGFSVYGIHGADGATYEKHLKMALSHRPNLIIDDGGDFTNLLHGTCRELAGELIAGTEETTTGIHRLRTRVKNNELRFPMMAVNDAMCKYLFDNRYGTGQSVWAAIMSATNNLIAAKCVVVAGYGWCGRGIAMRASAMGAQVIVTEIDPHRALEAAMDGYRVMKMADAAKIGDIFVTATGCRDVITLEHFKVMKNNAILANAGHFDVEISKPDLLSLSIRVEERKACIDGYYFADGRVINLMAEGRLVNLAAGMGHPAEIMDLSFAVQALAAEYLAKNGRTLVPGLYNVPSDIDVRVAKLKLTAMGISIDLLTPEQDEYFHGNI